MELSNLPYNLKVARACRCRQILRTVLLGGLLAIVFIFLLVTGAAYLSYLPRERYLQQASAWQRFKATSNFFLRTLWFSLSAPEDDPTRTPLPVVQLYLPVRDGAALRAGVPARGVKDYAGVIKVLGKTYRVKVRPRGDSLNHWSFPQKSWKVRLRGDKRLFGLSEFNLVLPRASIQIENWLGYALAAQAGYPAPRSFAVHFRLNREFNGIRVLTQPHDAAFLREHGFKNAQLLKGDLTTESVYGRVERKKLFESTAGWEAEEDNQKVLPHQLLSQLVTLTNKADRAQFAEEIAILVDIDAYTRYLAFLELVGTNHIDDVHNHRLVLDTTSKRFYPLIWDTVAFTFGWNVPIDNDTNQLFRRMLEVPVIRESKDRYLYSLVQTQLPEPTVIELINRMEHVLHADIAASPFKIHTRGSVLQNLSTKEWQISMVVLRQEIARRYAKIFEELQTTIVTAAQSQRELRIIVSSRAGALIKAIHCRSPRTAARAQLRLVGAILSRTGEVEFGVERRPLLACGPQPTEIVLSSARRFDRARGRYSPEEIVPVEYRYAVPDGVVVESITVANPHTGQEQVIRVSH